MTKKEKKNKSLDVIQDINKKFGKTVIKFASEEDEKERLPYGINYIDDFTGNGTVRGNFIIIYGGESTGKTSLVYHHIATQQKKGLLCCLIDLEHSYDKTRAVQLEVDPKKLLLIEDIEYAEQSMDIVIDLAKKGAVDCIYVDSIQAMSSKQEQITKKGKERGIEDDETALLARKLSKFFRVAGNPVYAGKVSVILIGQVRTDISKFGGLHSLSGGNALKHTSKQTLFLRRGQKADAPIEKVKEYYFDEKGKKKHRTIDKIIGFSSVIKIEKNHLSGGKAEGNELKLPFYFETGFNEPIEEKENINKGEKDEVDN